MSARLCSAAALPRCEDLSPRAEVAEGRAPRYNGGMETTAGLAYAVNVTEAPVTVKAKKTDDSTETIKVLESVGQHTFIAMSGETVFDGGAVGLVQGPFDPARALGDDGGAGNISPEVKAFLTWVTNGKISFSADGRLQIATSVDATGTFNHDGYASNYTKTVDGAKYTTTVNATEVIVKRSVAGVETVLMHLHDGVLELGGSRALTQENVAQTYDPAGTAPLSGAAVQQAITGGSTADDVRIFDAALPTMWETLMAGLATPRQLVESAIALQVAKTGAELNTLTPHKTDGNVYFLQTGAFSVNSVVGSGTSPNLFVLPTNVATCVVSGTAAAPNPDTRITLGSGGGTTDYFIYFPNDRASVSATLACCSASPNSTSSPNCKSLTLYAPKIGANPNGRFELLVSTTSGSNWNMNGAVVTLWLPSWNKYNRITSSGVPLLRDAVGSFDAFVYMPRMDATPFSIATKAKLTEASMLFILRTYGALVEHAAPVTLNIGCDAALQNPNAAEGDAPFLSEALNTAWNECATRNVSVAVRFNE